MHKLIETVLSIGSWLSEDDGSAVDTLVKWNTLSGDNLTIALHITLLDVRWESQESLAIWEDGS